MSTAADPRRKSVALAVVFSAILPGLGQVYTGYFSRGLVIALVFVAFIGAVVAGPRSEVVPMLGLGIAFTYLFGLIDGGQCANNVNMALDGIAGAEPPRAKARSVGGSLVGGSVLVVLGLIALLSIHTDMTMDWLADWWPIGLVALGGYVFAQGYRARRGP